MNAQQPSPSSGSSFDPYYTWLGIPPHDQPPNHYRLLGVELFESNRDVIDNAANRQMTHLRSCSIGARAAFAQDLLNQVAAARICLLDEKRRAEYDARLRQQIAPPMNQVAEIPFSIPARAANKPRSRKQVKSPAIEIVKIVVGGISGLAIGYVFLQVFVWDQPGGQPKSTQVTSAKNSSENSSSSKPPATSTKITPSSSSPVGKEKNSIRVPSTISDNLEKSEPDVVTSVPKTVTDDTHLKTKKEPRTDLPEPSPSTPGSATTSAAEKAPVSATVKSSIPDPAPAPVTKPDKIPASVALPPVDATSWQTLLPLSRPPAMVELIPAFDPVAAKISLSLEKAGGCEAAGWQIQFAVSGDPSNSKHGTLAELQVEPASSDLQFRWQANHALAAAALSNSWLRFELDSQTHFLALRQAQPVAPLKLNFEKERSIVQLPVESIPATDQLYLELASVNGLPSGASFRNGASQGKLDRELVIEFSDMPGAQIGIKLAKIPQSPLGLIVEPRFKNGPAREYDLTYAQVEKTQRAATEAVNEANAKIPALTTNLNNAQSALRAAQNRTVNNTTQVQQRAMDIVRLEAILRDFNKRIVAMREQEANAKSRLENVPKVVSFMRSLDGREIPFRILVKASVAELVLTTVSP